MAWQNNQWGYPQPNNYQQQFRPQQTSMDWIRVPNVADVEQVTVMPGQTAWVMAQNANVFAVRAADQMGIMDNRMAGVVRYPNGLAYNAGPSPFCGCCGNC